MKMFYGEGYMNKEYLQPENTGSSLQEMLCK